MASISKGDLLGSVSGDAGVDKATAEKVLTAFFTAVTQAAKDGNEVSWPGFGKFAGQQKAARTGRNPATGEPVQIAASTAMKFTASSTLKKELNLEGGSGQ